jgi:tetratricopeptide (TPR) repeat protein
MPPVLKRILLLTFAALALAAPTAAARQLDPPKLTPVATTEPHRLLIREGVALHERGDFDGAVRKYEQVLGENPHDVAALYEMSFALFQKKDYRRSLEAATRGARYNSELLDEFYVSAGNSLDHLGEPKKAVEVYKSGLKLAPGEVMLHYNLAITYLNLGKPEEARKSLKAAATAAPSHPSTQLALAAVFYNNGYRTPALLAAARFLALEPQSTRSDSALKIMHEVLGGGVKQGSNPNEINIFVNMGAKKDEGDFGSIDLMLGLSKAVSSSEKNKGKTETELLVEQVDSLIAIIAEGEEAKKQKTFVYQYYVPYFAEMKQRGLVEPFVYYTQQRSRLPGVREWLDSHQGRVMQFLTWSKNYRWPASPAK